MKRLIIRSLLCLAVLLMLPAAAPAQGGKGVIEGSLGYPSDYIPQDMVVCAEDAATKKQYCTSRHLKGKKFKYGVGYRLEVPPGDYVVFAFLPHPEKHGADYPKTYRAYYSEYVKCGMQVHCTSHRPVTVRVTAGKTLGRIDPLDWYNF
ncbi:MAG: hypothetical protein FJ128_11030 [Deltaproteobacteria bacterium]|nr:hypothetical protein [Deltaproteobacteria bacterium]